MADAAVSYGTAQAHAAPVQGAYATGPGGVPAQTQPVAQPQPQPQQAQLQAAPQIPVPQYAAAQAGTVPVTHPMVATVPVSAPPIPPTIVGNQAPQDPPPRRRARRATPASRGGRTRRAVAAPVPAAAMHPQQGPAAGVGPAAGLPTGTPAGTVGMAASALANGGAGMTQPSTDMWNQYSQAVNEFMSMQSKTIDKLLDRTYTPNNSTREKKSVLIDEAETTVMGDDEGLPAANATMDIPADGNDDEDVEEEIQEKAPVARAKRPRRVAPKKVSSKAPVMKSRHDSEEDNADDAEAMPDRKMSRNGQAEMARPIQSSRYDTPAPSPGYKRYDEAGAIDLASYYK